MEAFDHMTSTESPIQVTPHPFRFRMLRVKRTTWLTPRMVRVTLTGDDLPGFRSDAADDGARMFFPADPTDGSWTPDVVDNKVVFADESKRPPGREFTPRRYDAEANELDFDFVIHGDGPAATWARNAEPGHYVGVSGPRRSRIVTGEVNWYLLAGDATGLAALGRRIESAPAGTIIKAVVSVADAEEEQSFHTEADLELVWVHDRSTDEESIEAVVDALRAMSLPDRPGFAWAAGEAGMMRSIRRHILNERNIPETRMRVTGYWKRATPNYDHHQPLD